jgi:hypothetical protein
MRLPFFYNRHYQEKKFPLYSGLYGNQNLGKVYSFVLRFTIIEGESLSENHCECSHKGNYFEKWW